LFFSKNGIPSMTSCDTNGAIFKTVGDSEGNFKALTLK
jgi:hypothetical protein